MKSFFLLMVTVLLILMLIFSCKKDKQPVVPAGEQENQQKTASEKEPPVPVSEDPDRMGELEKKSDQGEQIVLGVIFSKTGFAAASNVHHIRGVRFAVKQINESGGLLGSPVKIIEIDSYSTPIQSRQAAQLAVEQNVTAVIGSSWSSHSLAIAPLLQEAGIPMISPDSTNPGLTEVGDYIFRACFNDIFQGEVLARFAYNELKVQTAAVFVDITSAYSLDLARFFSENFTRLGGRVLLELEYKHSQETFDSLFEEVKKRGPQLIFIPGHDESGKIVKRAQEMGIEAVFLGGDGWGYQEFYSNGGQELKEGYYTCHWSKDLDTPRSLEFVTQYRNFFEVNTNAAISYDAVMLFADAVRRAGSTDRTKIKETLAATAGYEGVTGNISFDSRGDTVKSAIIIKISDGVPGYFQTILP